MTNIQSWLLLLLIFAIIWLAVKEGERKVDDLIVRFHTSKPWVWEDQHDVFDDDPCPCETDRDYHSRKVQP